MRIAKTKHIQLFLKYKQNVRFHEIKQTQKIGYNWLHICGAMCFSVAGGERKLMNPKHIFVSPGKTEL